MSKRTPPCKAHPEWTEARCRQFVRSALRSAWQRWPPKWEALRMASKPVKGKRYKTEYQCAHCKEWFKAAEVQVDHIVPAGSDADWNKFIEGLFVGVDKLQVLCKPCHAIKTKKERKK